MAENRVLLLAAVALLGAVGLSGCQTSQGYRAGTAGATLGAAASSTPGQALLWGIGAELLRELGNDQAAVEAAREGRTQVQIYAKDSGVEYFADLPLEKGGKYTGQGIRQADGSVTFHGVGKQEIADGSKYIGQFQAGLNRHGQGVYTWPDGRKFAGEWSEGYPVRGTITRPDPDEGRYTGEVNKAGNPDGQGTFRFAKGGTYEGQIVAGKGRHGHGVQTTSDGARFEGEFENNRELRGTATLSDGTRVSGEWALRQYGTIDYPDGRKYQGHWDGAPLPGIAYTGWVLERPHGSGVMKYPDGSIYSGDWNQGKRQGVGKLAYPDGRMEDGPWEDDKFKGTATGPNATPKAPAEAQPAGWGSIQVSADVEGAEVYVDREFVGNSPAKLKLSAGKHVIEVKQPGYLDYKREVAVTDGAELSLKATLVKAN